MRVENMPGEFTPPEVGQQAALDAALDSSGKTNKSPLPAHGRPLSRMQILGLGIAGIVTAASAAGCDRLGISNPFASRGESPSPVPSGVVEPSNLPTPTVTLTETPSIGPSDSPTVTPSQTPEVTPTLSPEAQLRQEIADYSSGETLLPTDGRFYLYQSPGQTQILANILAFNGVVNTDYAQPVVEQEFEGYIIDTKVIKASDNKNYLIAEMVQESVKGSDGKSEQYILPINLGSVDSTSKDIDILITGKGIFATPALSSQKLTYISPADMKVQVENHKNEFVIFPLDVIKDVAQGYEKFRNLSTITAQNAIAKDILEFSKQTLKNPLSKVSQSNLIQGIINKPVEDGFDPSTIPMGAVVMFQ